MVEAEEILEAIGIFFGGLQVVDTLDLTVEKALIAAGEIDNQFADAFFHHALLLVGNGDSPVLEAVEGVAQLGQFGLAAHRKRFELRHRNTGIGQ